ncbi:MAG: tetratricopeptide repeat protein [Acidimicrobiaceae bacterium]|nr:tetratricopeptide repeat protein [Acidimicrobiaceae bacterium]
MSIKDLNAALAAVSIADAPDEWALAAYRLAVARSEAAGLPEDIDLALGLLDKAARILTADRAPVEHGRVVTAAANCHRAAGQADRALELFERAADLIAPRAPAAEHAAALINLGLAHCEAGHPEPAIEVLDRAVSLMTGGRKQPSDTDASHPGAAGDPGPVPDASATDSEDSSRDPGPVPDASATDSEDGSRDPGPVDEAGRLLGAALINRAQARQSLGRDEDVRAALGDYRSAMAALPTSSLQAGMAAHGSGAAALELCRRGVSGWSADDAVDAFEQSLSVLGHTSFPFHHAVARHSLALAFEMRGGLGDLARALNSAHASLAVFDPRLHAAHWRTAHATLARLEDALGEGDPSAGRLIHVARLLAATDETEREQLLRDRLLRAASLPPMGMRTALEALIGSVAALDLDDYREVLRTLVGVLMELPEQLLEAACDVLCRVHRDHDSTAVLDVTLDAVISDRLFGPQRVRVRDLLEANGWVRP